MTDDQDLEMPNGRDRLRERAQQLPRALEPRPELWNRIEAELTSSNESNGLQLTRQLWPIAALTLLGVALATLVFQAARPQPELAARQADATPQAPATIQVSTQMKNQLHQLLDGQLGELPEDVRATVIENLEIIAAARAEIHAALEQNPNSPLLHSLYLNSYANERTLLKDVEAMARQTKRRTYL